MARIKLLSVIIFNVGILLSIPLFVMIMYHTKCGPAPSRIWVSPKCGRRPWAAPAALGRTKCGSGGHTCANSTKYITGSLNVT